MTKELILVDASGYVFRTHYALMHAGLTSPDGKSTHIIMGVVNMVDRLQKQYPEGSIVMVFDGKGKGLRVDWDPNYKANRPPTPPEIKEQIPPLQEIIKARGIPLLSDEKLEADDIIATLTKEAKSSYERIIIASGDKDLAQLVEGNKVVMLYDDKKNILFDTEGVKEKWMVPPELIPDYLSLIGDKVDNIPGVEKVGPKTAVSWLTEYSSLQGIIDKADEIGGKVGDNLREALPHLPLSLKLNTLISDGKLPMTLKQIQQQLENPQEDKNKLEKIYRKFGLHRLLSSVTEDKPVPKQVSKISIITTEEDWASLVEKLTKEKQISLFLVPGKEDDNPVISQIIGIAFSFGEKEHNYYIPCRHDYAGAPDQLELEKILQDLAPIFGDPKKKFIFYNSKFDAHLLLGHNTKPPANYGDTMLLSYIKNAAQRHDLATLSEMNLGHGVQSLENLVGKGRNKLGMNEVEVEKCAAYAVECAANCLEIYEQFSRELDKEKSLKRVYAEIEIPLIQSLLVMEQRGALLDTKLLASQSNKLEKEMLKLREQAYKIAGEEFNLSSPAQLKIILYDKMGYSTDRKTSGGQLSTAEDVLQDLVAKGEKFPEIILQYRGLSKLKNTYTDALPQLVNPKSGRVHTSFNQAVASTGRLSSANPNLQNIPIRDEEGRNVRAAFIPPKGMLIVSADYSQIELRIMAHLSSDKSLLQAFAQGQDVHRTTAAEIFNVPLDQVDSEQRRRAKIANFGLIYGMGPYGLARQLFISNKEAQEFVALYFSRYPGVKKYMDDTRENAGKHGWAETLSGRRVYLPHINSSNHAAKQAAIRAAINAPVQGSAADLIKLAMIKLQPQLKDGEAHMILQVHDELVFEIKEDLLEKYRKIICASMESVAPLNVKLSVPLEVDFGYGQNWKEAH